MLEAPWSQGLAFYPLCLPSWPSASRLQDTKHFHFSAPFLGLLCKGKCEHGPRKMRLTGQPTLVWEKDSLRGLCDPWVGRAGGAECPCSWRASPAHVPNSSPPGKERGFLPGRQLF